MRRKMIYLISSILVLSVPSSVFADLVGHWTLDEGFGNIAQDSTANGNDGTFVGELKWITGKMGGALEFDGEAYVDCGNDASLNVTGPFSATIWINPGTLGGPDSVAPLCKADTAAGWSWQLRFAWGAGGQDDIIGWQFNSPGQRTWVYVGQVLPVGEWYHIAVSHDGETVKLYLDGEETDSAEMTGFAGSTAPFLIGSEGWGYHWIGGIDDVRLYDHGLSPPEILGIMVGEIRPIAWDPTPAYGAIHQDTWANLSWKPGPLTVSHDVYLGDNFDDVNDGTAETFQGNQATTSLTIGFPGFADPDGLIRGKTYYWRIDEVNDTEPNSPWKGDIWSFTIANYLVVDDFEAYNDLNPGDPEANRIFNVWLDGYDDPTNGALIGNDAPPFAEQSIVHRGAQSMPYFYDNSGTANYSEAERTFSPAQDWTRESVKVLSLWFKGYPAYMGSFVEGPTGTFTMTAEGADIWDSSDQFHFAYKELSGAGTIIAKVESVENTNEWAKAGVMIRDTLDADSRHAMVAISPGNGVWFGRREKAGGSSSGDNETGITTPQWVKIERNVGGLIKASYSADGTTWTQLATPESITMNKPMYIGLALTSNNSGVVCEAKFSNVSFPGTTVGQQWTNQDIGITSNDAEPMYVVLNGSAVVTHDNPDAAQIGEWTQWNIDLQAFADQGVNLTNVNTIAIGLGNRNNLQAGGSGMMYFDDIRLYLPTESMP